MYAYYRNGLVVLVSDPEDIPENFQFIEVPDYQLPIEPGYDYNIDFENQVLIKEKRPEPTPEPEASAPVEAQIKALEARQEFLEDCIAEMAWMVYNG